jgi:secretion/DNA translocation related CpaE-like protein
VVIISSRRPDHESWQRALRCGAVAVLDLSDRNLDLRAQLVRRVGATSSGRRVGLLASRGGAGCSALAVGMALAAAEHDRRVCLVDQDPLGGGLDLAMGLDQLPGPRWDDLYSDPQPDWAGLATALPGFSGVAVLSWGRHAICPIPVDPRLQDRALTQVTGDFDLTILDLGRCWGPENMQALNRCDALALLVPTELRALAGASRWAKLLAGQSARLGLVTHRTNSGNLPAANVADSIGLPVWAHLASERSVQLSLTRGELIPRHSALMRTSRKLLAQVAA